MNPEFWKGRRVFLTGHTGFKGSWLCLWLQELGAQLTGYALAPPTNPSLFESARVAEGMNSVIGDICDADSLVRSMTQARPEVIVHMAAQSLVRQSYGDPLETYRTNVLGTASVLEAARRVPGLRAIINVTTDKCYENREWPWAYRENDALGGCDPYSSSKACSEIVTAAYRTSFFNPDDYTRHGVALATARAGNVIGGGDWARDRLIPDILSAFDDGKSVRIRNPNAIRPWQHVLEPLSGYLTLAERLYLEGPRHACAWNFGPMEEDARSVAWIVETMAGLWGEGTEWEVDGGQHPHEATYLKLDISRARTQLNWRPAIGLGRALDLVVEWARARRDRLDLRQFSMEQIRRYQALRIG
jgi:CDP-glucose 4,6-dehydratase